MSKKSKRSRAGKRNYKKGKVKRLRGYKKRAENSTISRDPSQVSHQGTFI
jgi:hypothetical protein